MLCEIKCSFGEVIDKITILSIKASQASGQALININHELLELQKVPHTDIQDPLFNKLFEVNKKLWILKDLLRDKNSKKVFDRQFIAYAYETQNHNDQRYMLKQMINEKYNSLIKEEKIYSASCNESLSLPPVHYTEDDIALLEQGKSAYTECQYRLSFDILDKLIHKHRDGLDTINDFTLDLLFSYENSSSIFNKDNPYQCKIYESISRMKDRDVLSSVNPALISHCKEMFCRTALNNKHYITAYPYLNRMSYISGTNVHYSSMSFFTDAMPAGTTLLVYDGGGIGDKFMYGRFIPTVCQKYKQHNILMFINDGLLWLFNQAFSHLTNLTIVGYKSTSLQYDIHCSMVYLMKALNIVYSKEGNDDDVYNADADAAEEQKNDHDESSNQQQHQPLSFTPLFSHVQPTPVNKVVAEAIKTIESSCKPTFILNWKGNPENRHEKYNRQMALYNAIPLLELDIDWIVIQPSITPDERQILTAHRVQIYDTIDENQPAFWSSIPLIKAVKGVISTDTSLVHLSANLGVPTWVLLTTGCEWRWTRNDKKTNWYPSSVLTRQQRYGDWSTVVKELVNMLKQDYMQ